MLHDDGWKIRHDAKQILFDAATYLETHGWCQGAMRYKKCVCLFGAICEVSKRVTCGPDIMVDAEIARRLRKVTRCQGVAGWNDAPGRTKRQVISALNRAANL